MAFSVSYCLEQASPGVHQGKKMEEEVIQKTLSSEKCQGPNIDALGGVWVPPFKGTFHQEAGCAPHHHLERAFDFDCTQIFA